MSLDSRRLATFRAVARSGRISAAARLLHLSQPAVTAQVRQLEEACGRPLFVRSARGVTLSDAGEALLPYAGRVEDLLQEAALAVAAERPAGGALHLAASTTIASYVLPGMLAGFCRSERGARVRVDVGNTAQVLEWVRTGEAPLGLVEGLSRAPHLRLERLAEDELVPVVSSAAPPEYHALRRPADLARVPVIWREHGSGTRTVVERAVRRAAGRRPRHPGDMQLGSTEAIRTAVLLGLGVGFLSRWSIGPELAGGRLRILPLPALHVRRAFSWAMPAGEVPGLAGRFLAAARRSPPPVAA